MTRQPRQARDGEQGFALLVMLGVIGVGSVALLLAVEAHLPTLRERRKLTEANLVATQSAARVAFRRQGAFPVDLDGLASAAGLEVEGAWRRDHYGQGEELDYARVGADLRLRGRGVDGVLGSADDEVLLVPGEDQLRCRQRLRLRLLRAVFLRSPFRLASTMSAGDVAQMRTAMRAYAVARRRWLTADVTTRASLTTEMTAAAATVVALSTLHALPNLPVAIDGAGGLAGLLSLPDGRAVDGAGVPMQLDPVLGFVAVGADGVGGTDDDM